MEHLEQRAKRTKALVRRCGNVLAIVALLAGAWMLWSGSRIDAKRYRDKRPTDASRVTPREPELAEAVEAADLFEGDRERAESSDSEQLAEAHPSASVQATQHWVPMTPERATLPVEADGRFGKLYQTWLKEPEDAEATREATEWIRSGLTKLGLQPTASYLSCRGSLCRMGVAVEKFSDLHELRKIELPEGIEPEIAEPYTFGNTTAVVVYWSRRAED